MIVRLALPAIALIYATGCCCCGGGGSSSSSSSGGWQERLEEEAAEAIAEKVLEAATGAEDIEIDDDEGTLTIKTEEGTATFTGEGEAEGSFTLKTDEGTATFNAEGEESGTFKLRGADGETMDLAIGGSASVPDGFPLAVPSGAQVMMSNKATDGGKTVYMLMTTHNGGTVDSIAAHWEKELGALGKVSRTDINADGAKTVALVVDGMQDTAAGITEADGQLSSTITVQVGK